MIDTQGDGTETEETQKFLRGKIEKSQKLRRVRELQRMNYFPPVALTGARTLPYFTICLRNELRVSTPKPQ